MKLQLSINEINRISEISKQLEEVRDSNFQIKLIKLKDDLMKASQSIVTSDYLAAEVQVADEIVKELEALDKEKDEVLKKYALKDEEGLFILEETIDHNGNKNQNYTFSKEKKELKKRDAELKPIFEKIQEATKTFEEKKAIVQTYKKEVSIAFFEAGDKSPYFNLREYQAFTTLRKEEIYKAFKKAEEEKAE